MQRAIFTKSKGVLFRTNICDVAICHNLIVISG